MGALGAFSQSPVVTTVWGVIVWSLCVNCVSYFSGSSLLKTLHQGIEHPLHNQRCAAFAARAAQRQGGPGEAMPHSDKDVADGGSAGKGSEDEPDDETARPT